MKIRSSSPLIAPRDADRVDSADKLNESDISAITCSPKSDDLNQSNTNNSTLPSSSEHGDESSDESIRDERRKSPEISRISPIDSLTKEPTKAPNVTVMQPSATHAMFPFMYPSGGLFSSTSSIPFPLGHMFSPPYSSQFPFLNSSQSDINNLPPSHPLSLSVNPLSQHSQSLLQPAYSTGSGSSLTGSSSLSPPHAQGSQLGPMFSSRTSPRYTPYSLPTTKHSEHSPVGSAGLPLGGASDNISPRLNGFGHHSPQNRSPVSLNIPLSYDNHSKSNELRNMERMLSGLDRQKILGAAMNIGDK